MSETKHYEVKGKQIFFHELRHCLYSNIIKKKQES